LEFVEEIGFPIILRPSFTLGGSGGGIAYNLEEFEDLLRHALDISPIHRVLIEQSVIGWKEYELEVMRDWKDNAVVICSIENFDPMGVHTGDSITVAPAQTLTDKEYQRMRDAAFRCIRAIGVETGGSNIQFAVNPENGEMLIIEMNPRVSRSSALASKATGFPIAKFAAKLAVGYTLDEIPNDITKETPASFEPTIDYCVVKIPRWAFEKFPGADPTLTTQMKSVGEVMAIGRTFKEALQKGLRSLEVARFGFGADGKDPDPESLDIAEIRRCLRVPNPERIFFIRYAFQKGMSVEEIYELSKIDPWFLHNLREIYEMEQEMMRYSLPRPREPLSKDGQRPERAATTAVRPPIPRELLWEAKRFGFSDVQLAYLLQATEQEVRAYRESLGIRPTTKLVDTCAAEFEAYTPYYYNTYEVEDEVRPSNRPKIVILGGGPNRIGQGIEFDYCCVHAVMALREAGYETIMINSNPETVSTDYDTADKLYFEPLTREDVLNIVQKEQPQGVIVQFGGQTPLNLALALEAAGVPIIGTPPRNIHRAEDREQFRQLLNKLGLRQAPNGSATSLEEAKAIAQQIGYPVLVRPSYVLGGRAMEIVYTEEALERYMREAVRVSPDHPVLIDKFLEDAIEVDVDAISDGRRVVIGGIMEHVEEAGIHSGDSTCYLPPYSLVDSQIQEIRRQTHLLARELEVVGLINIQFAIKESGPDEGIYVLEVNPRASRTVPFVSKAIGVPLAKLAALVMVGKTLDELGFTREIVPPYYSVKEPVFPFIKFPGVDAVLGPEMRSTGEVMGIDKDLGLAFYKAYLASGQHLPTKGCIFISVNNRHKRFATLLASQFVNLGFELVATEGTGKVIREAGIPVKELLKVSEGRPNVIDMIKNREIHLLIDTPSGLKSKADHKLIRQEAVRHGIPIITTMSAAIAAVHGIARVLNSPLRPKALQDYHKEVRAPERLLASA